MLSASAPKAKSMTPPSAAHPQASRAKLLLRNVVMLVIFGLTYYPLGVPKIAETADVVPAHNANDLPNFHRSTDYLLRGGFPTLKGLDALKEMGVKTIVDLRRDDLQIYAERMHCAKLGINYISLPMGDFVPPKELTDTYMTAVAKAQKDPTEAPVFLHCSHGSDRTSFLVALWRVQHQNWSLAEAGEEMLRRGFLIHKLRKDDKSAGIFD
jgi:protein tyrosine/serine phosphatase